MFLIHLDDDCGVVFRKQDLCTLYEPFLLSEGTAKENVPSSYPMLAVEIPNQVFDHADFRSKIAGFLSCTRIELLTEMLCEVGLPVKPKELVRGSALLDPELGREHVITQLGKMKVGGMLLKFILPVPLLRMHRCSRRRWGHISETGPQHSVHSAPWEARLMS